MNIAQDHVVLPDDSECSASIANESKLYTFFKDFIGALDGTHIPCTPPRGSSKRFCNRKGFYSQNVFAACDFNLRFVQVHAGWEGSAHDGAVLVDAMLNGFAIPEGKFYLGDAGFGLTVYCLTPYRGVQYHLRKWKQGNQRPQNYKELYNLLHVQARKVIERIFGVLKKRFPGLKTSMEYPFETQVLIVYALCFLHSIISDWESGEFFMQEDKRDLLRQNIMKDLERRKRHAERQARRHR